MKILRIVLFTFGLILIVFNIFGLFKSLRNEELYSEITPYKNDISIHLDKAKKQWHRTANENKKNFALRATMLINHSIAHYWRDEGITKYHLLVPVWENYLLWLKQKVTGDKKYEFRNYKKAIERGVGLCSQASRALKGLLNDYGIDAEIYDLAGHVIVPVKFKDGTGYVLDPDYGKYVPFDIEAIEANPELVRGSYADQDDVYVPYLKVHKHTDDIVKMYEKDGNHIYFLKKGFEDFSYIAIWIIPLLLLLPYLLCNLKKHKS